MVFLSEYLYLPFLVLAFLIVDLLIDVESIRALLSNIFFWFYWLVYSVATETAFYFLDHASNGNRPLIPKALLTLVAIVATTTVLQSLTFKVGSKPVLDFSRYLDDYRRKVLSSSAEWKAKHEKKRVLEQGSLILRKLDYKVGQPESEIRMKAIYADVMLFGARDATAVEQEILRMQQSCANSGASFGALVASRVAQADPEWVRNFIAR